MIKLNNISLGYDNNLVIKDMSLNIEKGSYVAVVGENGSGKSTLIKGILGLIKPKKGSIEYNVKKHDIGYLPQKNEDNNSFPASVYEIVISGCLNNLGLRPFYNKKEKELVNKTLKELNIYNLKNKSYNELSGGQKQRVLLARAITSGKKVLVLDEPVTGLDYNSLKDLYNIIDKLNKKGMTIIMISHDVDKMIEHATHILYIKKNSYSYSKTIDFVNNNYHECFGDHKC